MKQPKKNNPSSIFFNNASPFQWNASPKFSKVKQSYWGNSVVPISKQRNDDNRLGGPLLQPYSGPVPPTKMDKVKTFVKSGLGPKTVLKRKVSRMLPLIVKDERGRKKEYALRDLERKYSSETASKLGEVRLKAFRELTDLGSPAKNELRMREKERIRKSIEEKEMKATKLALGKKRLNKEEKERIYSNVLKQQNIAEKLKEREVEAKRKLVDDFNQKVREAEERAVQQRIEERRKRGAALRTRFAKETLVGQTLNWQDQIGPSGSWSKSSMRAQKDFSRGARSLLRTIIPGGIPSEPLSAYRGKGTGRGRGRPKGPSGKYVIPGKGAVRIAEYKQWVRLQRLSSKGQAPSGTLQQQFEQRVNTQPRQYQQPSVEQTQQPAQQIVNEQPTQTVYQQPQVYDREAIRAKQMALQESDQILKAPTFKAPNFMTGEMVGTVTEETILNAPNINEGGMRNVTGTRINEVELGDRPQTNPDGDEYIDIEPGSGKQRVMIRPREKWATGEAL